MNFSKLDKFMQEMPARGIPGCELVVTKDREVVYRTGVGFADQAKTRPVSNQDLYWIFSATKVITCIAAMRLVEEGKLQLDDPVSKYIPEFANLTVLREDGSITPAQNVMTVEHLFTMTGGMSYDKKTPAIRAAATPTASTLDVVRAMAKDPLLFEPGTHYKYSLCHDVLSAVVEVITGKRFDDYLRELIFDPLGIKDMGFHPTEEQKNRFCDMYTFHCGTMTATLRECKTEYCLCDHYDSGGAGLFASVDEYIKIITVIANGGTTENGYRLLKPETIAMMQQNHLHDVALNDYVSGMLFGYGWGLCGRVHMDPTVSLSPSPIGEFGWDGAASAFVVIDPIEHVAIYFGTHLHNCGYAGRVIHPNIRRLVYEGLKEI